MTTKLILIAFIVLLSVTSIQNAASAEDGRKYRYPATRVDTIVETMHGVDVADPYRWLEATDSEEVRSWVEAQNQFARSYLDKMPGREAIQKRLGELLSVGTISTPVVRDQRYFYSKRDGRQNQPIVYVRDGRSGEPRVLIDPNSLSADGTTALDWFFPSLDGKLVAYGLSASGSEMSTLRVLEVDSGEHRDDTIPNTRACSLAWLPDGSGFYYTRYPKAGSVAPGEENYHRHVFYHALGTDVAHDLEVFGSGRKPQDWPNVDLSPNGRWLLVTVSQGWAKSEMYIRDVSSPGSKFKAVAEGIDALFRGDMQNDRLYLQTNFEAPRYRVFAVDPSRPSREHWSELIPERQSILQGVAVVGNRLFAESLHDASSRLEIFSLDGQLVREIRLPTIGTVTGLGGEWDGGEAFYGFVSFSTPAAIYRLDLESKSSSSGQKQRESELWEKVDSATDPSQYTIKQVKFASRDGTEVPMFVLHRTGLDLDGNRPTVLSGYGGFNVSQSPAYIPHLPMWLERGGVFCIANLRGGGEYGESWHQAGMLANKQNVFDDFIAAAEWLVANGYTNRDRLAVSGGSNGGLLVGAALTQCPEHFRAVVCRVPLLDMLRYHHFRIAKLWIPEYGSAEDPKQFAWLHAYSPYHRVQDGVAYPSVLFTTAESDSRVDPMHALKMAARLQAASSADRPILLRVESKAGHGAGKPLSKTIDEQTDIWSFLYWQLGVEQ
jgi:prolyl oligopeptidase